MSVVCNSSPLINLARIGHLDLLRQLYGEVVIPEAVWHEVVVAGVGQPGADEVRAAPWVRRRPVENKHLVRALRQELDAGEAEAIALALEIEADLLLMDERLGRENARYLGVHTIGLIGAIVEARHKGLIEAVAPYLTALRTIAGFHLREALYKRVLQDAGEA